MAGIQVKFAEVNWVLALICTTCSTFPNNCVNTSLRPQLFAVRYLFSNPRIFSLGKKAHYVHNAYNINFQGDSMINIVAREAKVNFGELMDTAQRERLQLKVSMGFDQLDKGEYSSGSVKDIFNNAKKIHEKIQIRSTS